MIGGNIQAVLQRKNGSAKNAIGERIHTWEDVQTLTGFLDLSGGNSTYSNNAKFQDSTHVFVCDYTPIDRNPENKRMVVNGFVYDVMFIDDPMELHQHLEIILKYVGAV
jgi:SPP1 family predicted phage head-tail adaptor